MKINWHKFLCLLIISLSLLFYFNLSAHANTPKNQKTRGFEIRGMKGWAWTPKQYLEEIPHLKNFKMNFLMICYISMCDIENYKWGDDRINRWWEPLPEVKKRAYEKVIRSCKTNNIEPCFSINPYVFSKRPINPNSLLDIDALWQHYSWMQSLGVNWFNISTDDVGWHITATDESKLANELLKRLRIRDRNA